MYLNEAWLNLDTNLFNWSTIWAQCSFNLAQLKDDLHGRQQLKVGECNFV